MVLIHLTFIMIKVTVACRRTTPRPECTGMPSSIFPSFEGRQTSTTTQGTAPSDATAISTNYSQDNDEAQLYNCGLMAVDPDSSIIKGRNASEKAWPWVGLVRGKLGLCGATLISDSWVLTAAHCVPGVLSVAFGQTDKNRWTKNSQYRFPSQEVIHRHYDKRRKASDLAMVKLDKPVLITDYVRPACLPFSDISYSACYAAGWGRDSHINPFGARFLNQLKVNIMPNNICAYKWMMDGLMITHKQVCLHINVEGAGLCSGDSGSPLSCKSGNRYYAAAVASFVETGCKRKFFPDVYTRTLPYLDWIKHVMEVHK